MPNLSDLRHTIRAAAHKTEAEVLQNLCAQDQPTVAQRQAGGALALDLVRRMRSDGTPGLMEVFLAEYGLSTDEGVALMCLAEALLRVPDAPTIDALIEDKIAPSDWGKHLGKSSSSLVNASTWALMLTGVVVRDGGPGVVGHLRQAIQRLGEPVIRAAVSRAMKELGHQFVLGQTIDEALTRGADRAKAGYTFSYDMLGEAALTDADADTYYRAYADAIARLAVEQGQGDIRTRPGISIKLSALHPRYEAAQHARVMTELVPRAARLCQMAAEAGMGLNIDAEEADRLDLSLDVIEALLRDPALAGWDGFGVVVQAYGKRAAPVIDWLHALAVSLDRRIMVRLVKGAYWDTEVKRAQMGGHGTFPVFTRKAATDASYLCCAHRLLRLSDRIYPQFATHNAHTVAAILSMGADPEAFEFQRLHGMGDTLYDGLIGAEVPRCRIYAPVGAHRDLLAYLVRRLLENGANSSFVHQILNEDVPPDEIVSDPFEGPIGTPGEAVMAPQSLFGGERANARGWDLADPVDWAQIEAAREKHCTHVWTAAPVLAGESAAASVRAVHNPADPNDLVGHVRDCTAEAVPIAVQAADPWGIPAAARAAVLRRAADLYEARFGEVFALLAREAGKTPLDAVAELREAVDFLRYYAARAEDAPESQMRGLVACISPWNFPLAIFTGQIAAALAAGNAVLAKPAEATVLTAALGTELLHKAGVPRTALQLLPGPGAVVGAALSAEPRLNGMCFTGSTTTAQAIHRAMAPVVEPAAPLIAETGGLNAMIVDSTALPEQAVRDVVASAFQSAGQRCSALRVLYLQQDIAPSFLKMLYGAMDALVVGPPWVRDTDVGPVIDVAAKRKIDTYVDAAAAEGRLLKRLTAPSRGTFVAPAVVQVTGIEALEEEIFGPVLHVAIYRASALDKVVSTINDSGYGLTFGMHSRIDDRIAQVTAKLRVGNIYVNRNQIGAVVGSQPFGGEEMSGTGPKAGGPAYVQRFRRGDVRSGDITPGALADPALVQAALDAARGTSVAGQTSSLPGPTGESNRLTTLPRGTILCLGPNAEDALAQAAQAQSVGCTTVAVAPGLTAAQGIDGRLSHQSLTDLTGFAAVALWSTTSDQQAARTALAARPGPILPLLAEADIRPFCQIERHVSIDTTAAGGNAALLAKAS